MNLCLRNVSKLLDLEYFLLENAVCPFKIYRHDASQVSTKKRNLAIFWRDRQYFCLIIKQKAGWLVARYDECVINKVERQVKAEKSTTPRIALSGTALGVIRSYGTAF